MKTRFGKMTATIALSLIVAASASFTAFAASEKKFETKQGGSVTVSNVADEKSFTDEGAGIGDTLLIANESATVTVNGDGFQALGQEAVTYYPEATFRDNSFQPGNASESIALSNNSTTLSKPGYYVFSGIFGSEYSPDTTAAFVLQIAGEAAQEGPRTAAPTASNVLVNGKQVAFEAYNIDGNNFFKLRDLAAALDGSQKNFEVSYDSAANAISIISNNSYTNDGTELAASSNAEAKTANPTSSKILIDALDVKLTVYNIDGNNFFKLRDLAKALDIGVTYDGSTSTLGINTKDSYKE